MEDLHSFEDCTVNNIIFLDFLEKSKEVLKQIPKEKAFEQFPKSNSVNSNKYYNDWRFYFLGNSMDLLKKKKKVILDWAKENHCDLQEKYDEKDLSTLMDEKLFPCYNKTINSLHDENSLLLPLLNYHIINNLSHTITFLSRIKDIYLKKKDEALEANESYAQLFEKSENSENELKRKIDSLEKKISSLHSKIQNLLSEKNELESKNAILEQEASAYIIDSQNYDSEMNNLREQIKSLNVKMKNMEKETELKLKESESKIEEVKKENESKYNALTNFITELIDKFSLDLTQKIEETSKEMKNKLKNL